MQGNGFQLLVKNQVSEIIMYQLVFNMVLLSISMSSNGIL